MGREANACYEFLDAVQETQIEVLETTKTRSPGIVLAKVKAEGDVVALLRQAFQKKHWVFGSLLKASAVYCSLRADDEKGILELSERLNSWVDGSKYRVTLRRVKNEQTRRRIIELVAAKIRAPVDLENYAREIIVYYVDSWLHFVLGRESEVSVEDSYPATVT